MRFRARLRGKSGGGAEDSGGSTAQVGKGKPGGPESEHPGTTSVYPERRALSPNRSPTAPEHRRGPGTRAPRRYRADTPRAWL